VIAAGTFHSTGRMPISMAPRGGVPIHPRIDPHIDAVPQFTCDG